MARWYDDYKKEKLTCIFECADRQLEAYGFDKNGETLPMVGPQKFEWPRFSHMWIWLRYKNNATQYTDEYHEDHRRFTNLIKRAITEEHIFELAELLGLPADGFEGQTATEFICNASVSVETLSKALERHRLPDYIFADDTRRLVVKRKITAGSDDDVFSDILNIDLDFPKQLPELTPVIRALSPEVKILEPGQYFIKYAFKQVMVRLSSPNNPKFSMNFNAESLNEPRPAGFAEQGYKVTRGRQRESYSFHICARECKDRDFVKELDLSGLGQLENISAGDEIDVDLMVEIDPDNLEISGLSYDKDAKPLDLDAETMEILSLLVNNELRMAKRHKSVTLQPDGQHVTLTSYHGEFFKE